MHPSFTTTPPDASYVIAFLLVAFYAGSRFRTPKSVRSQTSRLQFLLSAGAYITSCTGVFILLAWTIRRNSGLIQVLHFGASESISNDITNLDAALVAALMMTTLLPNFPMLRDVDNSILRFFHKMGSIPFGAQLWAGRMESCFTIPSDALAAMREYIQNSPHLPDTLIAELQTDPSVDRVRFRFTRNLYIYVALSNLKGRARFADEYPEDAAGFEKKMDSYLAQCVGFLALAAKLSPQELQKVPESVEKFRSLNLEAYEELRLMLARVMLYSSSSESEMIKQLSRIGFALQRPKPVVVPLNLLAFDMVIVLVLFALATSISFDQQPLGKAIGTGLQVSFNLSIAALSALLPKQVWSCADMRSVDERPYLSYVVSALVALALCVPVTYAFYMFRMHFMPDSGPILPFPPQCKWLLLSMALAFALAFACDDHVGGGQEPTWLRWAESASIAALMGVVGLLVVQWLAADHVALHAGMRGPRLWMPIMLNAAIGGLFGATFPRWYRDAAYRATAAETTPRPMNSLVGSLSAS